MSKKCIQIWLEVQIYFQKKSQALNRLELRDGCYLGKIFNLWCFQTKIYLFLRTMQHTPYHRARNSLQTFDHNCYTCHLWYVHACQSWVWSGFHVTMSSNPIWICTGKSLSEALIFASTNPQYGDRLFIKFQVQHMKIPSSNLRRTFCVQKLFLTFRTIFVHNMLFRCSGKRRASEKDLPVSEKIWTVLVLALVFADLCIHFHWLSLSQKHDLKFFAKTIQNLLRYSSS